ncbi:MAG: hypothetical protein ABSH28_22545 [Acidobacteriota bacterium]
MIRGESLRSRDHCLHRELLHAMENARSRLAVAVASENKATPRERWRYYLETEDRMRRCVREIRRNSNHSIGRQFEWLRALDLLKQPLPADERQSRGEAQLLCQRIYDVLAIIEGDAALMADESRETFGA